MKSTRFLVDQLSKKQPVLIIDKRGVIGSLLARALRQEFLPVLVSAKKPEDDLVDWVVYIPFRKKPPKIPENNFPFVFYIDSEDRFVRGLIPSLMSYAKRHNAKLNILTSIYQRKLKQFERLSEETKIQFFVLGDVFGDGLSAQSILGSLLLSAKYSGTIRLPNHGLDDLYPVSAQEVVRQVVKITFSPDSHRNVVALYPAYPLTGLAVSRVLLEINPDFTLDFLKKNGSLPQPEWQAKDTEHIILTPIDMQIHEVYEHLPEVKGEIRMKRGKIHIPYLSHLFALGFFLSLVVILPLFTLLAFSFIGAMLTKESIAKLEEKQFPEARVLAQQAMHSFSVSENLSELLTPVSNAVGRGMTVSSFQEKLRTAKSVDGVLIDITYALESFEASDDIEDEKEAKTMFVSSMHKLRQALLTLSQIEAEGKIPHEYEERLKTLSKAGDYFLRLYDVLPSIMGYDGKRRYLLLFQNNNELRPGGGFIGSYGLMTVHKGKLIDLTIHDVYDADGQLSARIEPPFPLKEYLGATHWYLRDSNFAIDFPDNAARSAYFLKLETGEVVDGVIGVDTVFIANLLKATGPIEVLDFNETVTAENFSEKTQMQIEEDFFPGSQKKKQFLTAFYDTLSQKVLDEERVLLPKLLQSLLTSLEEKHVMFAFANENDQTPFTVANLSGSLWDSRREEEKGFNDFLGIIEANLGENKVNAFIERYIKHDVLLSESGLLTTSVQVLYTNTSSGASPFGGPYKNYVRFVVPEGTSATKLTIDGQEKVMLASVEDLSKRQERGRVAKNTVSIDLGEEKGKKTVGFLLEIPPGKKTEVGMEFQANTSFNSRESAFLYDLSLFKQPGRGADPYTFTFSYPSAYQVVSSSGELKKQQGRLSSFFLLKKDRSFTVTIGKK